jgi:hypothetical protein
MASINSDMVPLSARQLRLVATNFAGLTNYCCHVECGHSKASCAAIQTEIWEFEDLKGGSHVRDWSRGSTANGRYGPAGDVVLAANCDLDALCHHHGLLLRGLLHCQHHFIPDLVLRNCADSSPHFLWAIGWRLPFSATELAIAVADRARAAMAADGSVSEAETPGQNGPSPVHVTVAGKWRGTGATISVSADFSVQDPMIAAAIGRLRRSIILRYAI